MRKTALEEQETIISYDYYEKMVNVYSNRPPVIRRLTIKLGKSQNKGALVGEWRIPFSERKILSSIVGISNYLPKKKKTYLVKKYKW